MRRSAQSRGGLRNVSSDSHVVLRRTLEFYKHMYMQMSHAALVRCGLKPQAPSVTPWGADYARPSWSLDLADTHPSEGMATLCAAGTAAAARELTERN